MPEIRVTANWPGASPRQIERYIAAPIERILQTIPGTARVESLSEESTAFVTAGVAEGIELEPYVVQVGEALERLRGTLPDRVAPQLTKRVPEALREEHGFMTLQLVGPGTPDVLRELAEEAVTPRLRSVPGVADVLVEGGTERELLVAMEAGRLAAYSLTVADVRQPLAEALQGDVYGALRIRGERLLLVHPAEDEVTALRGLVVSAPMPSENAAAVRLSDVAEVHLGPAPLRSITRINGQAVVSLTVERAQGTSMIAASRAVQDRLSALEKTLPEGTRLLVALDKTEAVRVQLRDLAWRGGLGLLLVVIVLLLLLKSVRAALVVLYTVAVSLAVAFLLLRPLGLTLNLLTLAGLVLVFGLLVDNAVVVVEQLILQRSKSRLRETSGTALERENTQAAIRAVGLPLVGGTISTAAVMLPLVYLSGELRALFVPFGVLVGVTLLTSLAGAAVLVPALRRFLPPPEPTRRRTRLRRWVHRLAAVPYQLAAGRPRLTLLTLILLIGVPAWLLPQELAEPEKGAAVPTQRLTSLYNRTLGSATVQAARQWIDPALGGLSRMFVQNATLGTAWSFESRPVVRVRLGFPPGNPIERSSALLRRFEEEALASEAVHRTLAQVYERQALLTVEFTDGALRGVEPFLLRERLIGKAINLAGIDVSVFGLLPEGYSSRTGSTARGFRLEAYGPNYEDLKELSRAFAERLQARSRRMADVDINSGLYGFEEKREVLRFNWGAGAQLRSGVDVGAVAGALRPILNTRFPLFYADLEGMVQVPVRLVVEGADEIDVARLARQPLLVGDSTRVQLGALSSFDVEEMPARIERADQQYKRYIQVDYRGPARIGTELIEAELAAFTLPPGYRIETASFAFFDTDVRRAFWLVLLATLGLIYLVTAAVFESWRLPLVVLLSVPTAVAGLAIGFLATGAPLAEGAFIGVVLLAGIAVNDAILLVDRYRQLRELRPHTASGVLARLAVRERLRPMWTTTLSTAAGLLPLLLFPDEGNFWFGLAVTVTGGLLSATLLAPLATVAVLTLGSQKI